MSAKFSKLIFSLIFLGAVLGVTVRPVPAQDLKGFSRPRTVTRATTVNTVPRNKEAVVTGNITKANGDIISVCDMKGLETVVVLNPKTKIATHRRGIFRGPETLDQTALMIGLRVQVKGRGNDEGQLNAKWIKFHDSDLRAMTEIETRSIPIEAEQARQSEQLEETDGIAKTALKNAKNAQESADKAQVSADRAQNTAEVAKSDAAHAQARIGAIDDFEATEALTVLFNAGSFKLTPGAKVKLDEFATKAKTTRGYVIELSGFASSEGGVYKNHELSAKRVEAVMDYLIGVGNVPIRRIVVPYSGGIMSPVADNNTRAGREQNRRVEVRMLVSKGLAAQERVANK
jgi:outer membrane protein OmpA-like peptidoglycan-associated protein